MSYRLGIYRGIGYTFRLIFGLPCGNIMSQALSQAGVQAAPQSFLCRTSDGWFLPTAYVTLLPRGDSFQVWPLARVPVLRSVAGTHEQATTAERFAISTLAAPSTDEDFQIASESNAVVISPNGMLYVQAPAFAESTSIRAAVLADYRHHHPQDAVSAFMRVLPPLAGLPSIQFAAMHDVAAGEPNLFDFRPIGGGLVVVSVEPDTTPVSRLRTAVVSAGEPVEGQSVEHLVLAGRLRVLHREMLVDPRVALRAEPPIALIITPMAAPIPVMAAGPQPSSTCSSAGSRRDLANVGRGHVVPSMMLCALIGSRLGLGILGCALTVVSPRVLAGSGDEIAWECDQAPETTSLDLPDSLASLAAHRRLADILYAYSDSRPIGGPFETTSSGAGTSFRVELWSPTSRLQALFPSSVSTQGLRSRVKQASELPRGTPVLVHPQIAARSVQFVSPSTSPQVVTIIVDSGFGWDCIDVPRTGTGQAILAQLSRLYPGSEFRLGSHPTLALRHGDVILACQDTLSQSLAGIIRLPNGDPLGRDPGALAEVVVSAVDLGLVRVRVPTHATAAGVLSALTHWLGRQRCLGAGLHKVTVPGSTVQLFCLPRRARSTLTAVLTDLEAEHGAVFVTTVDDVPGAALSCASLMSAGDGLGAFWGDVLKRRPFSVGCQVAESRIPHTGAVWRHVHLCLDYCRADSFGWRPVLEPGPALYDLVAHPPGPSVDWYLGGSGATSVSTQTSPSHWPLPASPLYSEGLPVRRRPVGCALAPGMYPAGTLHHLECPHYGLHCTIPCVPGYKLWAFRLGQWVRGACTESLTWTEVMAVASLTPWDLAGTMIHGDDQVWVWPADVASLEGKCGHLFHDGSDPYLCGRDVGNGGPSPSTESGAPHANHGQLSDNTLGLWGPVALSLREPKHRWLVISMLALRFLWAGSARSPATAPAFAGESTDSPGFDITQTCNIGWCHELACQTTHFAVSSRHLLSHFSQHSPFNVIRVSLWVPFRGPVLFEIHRGSQLSEFDEFLLVAGHNPDRHSLFVAFDTHATSPDILSVPTGDTVWWIIRDGLSRELLCPVSPWYEPPDRLVATVNSHGQASTVAFSPEVSTMRRLPQGARGNTAVPMQTVIGHLTAQGLVLMEIAIGSLTAARELTRSHACTRSLLALAWLPLVLSMQTAQDLAVRARRQDPWGGIARVEPTVMRVWTHTLEAPLTLPFQDVPDVNRLTYCVAFTRRGVVAEGECIWTQPRIVQGVAHILHIPRGVYPTLVFWLLHYRARASVVAAAPGVLDWGHLGQTAHETFGENFFARGGFCLQYHSGIVSYGTAVTPPHGAILHLVRAVPVPQASANVWDTAAEPAYVSHFDYDICMGPRGEPTLVEGDQTQGQADSTGSRGLARSVDAAGLARQINHVCHQLDTLTIRLESVGVLPSSDADGTQQASEPASATAVDSSASSWGAAMWVRSVFGLCLAGSQPRTAIILCSPLWGVLSVRADGSEGSDSGPAEPSSPDLADWQPPTPAASEPPTVSDTPILQPSGSSLARTTAPFEGAEASTPAAFPAEHIPVVQRRVAAAIQGVDIEPSTVPFLPPGCPVMIHNPFTGQTQCPALSSRVGTSHQLTEVLQDYSDRRGWQPIVCVQPQPDAQGVHLMPSAADARLVSVLFRNGAELRPRCIERDFRYGPTMEVPFW